MAVTIRDVAEKAGVSATAVSKVLHGKGGNVRVSEATASLIVEAAESLRYQPNNLALSFRTKRTNTIALVFEHFQRVGDRTGYFSHLLNGVMSATFSADFSLTICPKLIKNSAEGLLFDGRFDGIVWCKPDMSEETRAAIWSAPVPVVCMHIDEAESPGVPSFCCDNRHALRTAVGHLAGLGHRRIGFAVDPENETSVEAIARIAAFHEAMASEGLASNGEDVLKWDHDGASLQDYRNGGAPHTGIIFFSESHAVSFLRTAEGAGIRVPEDLSVIGFDSTPFCETTSPRLTAISQPIEQMAQDATQRLIAAIRGEAMPLRHFTYPCGLDVRDSTARPRISPTR